MSPLPIHPVFDEWFVVQRQAHEAEVALLRTPLGCATWPAAGEKARVLRRQASLLLPRALAEMERLAASLRAPRLEVPVRHAW